MKKEKPGNFCNFGGRTTLITLQIAIKNKINQPKKKKKHLQTNYGINLVGLFLLDHRAGISSMATEDRPKNA